MSQLSPARAVQLRLDGFAGPLDLLLELARRQRVDLARISIATLVDQYLDAVAKADRGDLGRIRLHQHAAFAAIRVEAAQAVRSTPSRVEPA